MDSDAPGHARGISAARGGYRRGVGGRDHCGDPVRSTLKRQGARGLS